MVGGPVWGGNVDVELPGFGYWGGRDGTGSGADWRWGRSERV